MNKNTKPMRIHIMDKEYLVACPDNEREALFASAELLTEKMKEIRDTGKVVGADRIAVMAALNMANDLIHTRVRDEKLESDLSQRLKSMVDRVDDALSATQQLDL